MAKRVYYTARWRALRKAKLQTQPLCEICARRGRVVPATVVDHKRSIASGGDPFPPLDGLASMCAPCHNAKTAARDNPHAFGGGSPIAFKGCDANGLPIDENHPFNGGDTPLGNASPPPLQPTSEISADLIRNFF